jgi:type IV secretory pathway protease TraF
MKTEKAGPNGFVMILVIVILALIGTYMIVMASESNGFLFQADRAYLESCRQNLTASGLVWAKKNVNAPPGVVSLNTAGMNIKGAILSVTISAPKKGRAQVEINTSCSRARHQLTSSKKYTIETRP